MMNEHSPRLISCRLPSTVWRVRVANSMDWKPTLRICCATILSSGTIFTIPISTVPTSKNLWRQNKVPDLCFGIFVWLKTFRNRITFILYKLIRENCLCVNWTIHNSVFRNPNTIIISAIWRVFFGWIKQSTWRLPAVTLHLQRLVNVLRLCVLAAPGPPVFGTPVRESEARQAVQQRVGEQQIFVSNVLAPRQDSLETKKEDQWTDATWGIKKINKKNMSLVGFNFNSICLIFFVFVFITFSPEKLFI